MTRRMILLTMTLGILLGGVSWADQPPYLASSAGSRTEPSATGSATADASADDDGNLSVSASASEDALLPIGLLDGRSEADAGAGVLHIIGGIETPGTYTVTATLSDVVASASSSGGIPAVTATSADVDVEAVMFAMLFDCSDGLCHNVMDDRTEGFARVMLACDDGCTASSGTHELTVEITTPDGFEIGEVYVEVGISASAVARGQSEGSGSASTRVSSIVLAPTG